MTLPLSRRTLAAALSFCMVGTLGTLASAEDLQLHALAGAAKPISKPQSDEYGVGAAGGLTLEVAASRLFGVQVSAGGVVLPTDSGVLPPGVAPRSTGVAGLGLVGVRIRPLGRSLRGGGLWLDVEGGAAFTGGSARPAFDGHLGYDFPVSFLEVGPFLGFTQLVQPEDVLRPEDARILGLGLHVAFGHPGMPEGPVTRPRTDRDNDGVFDDEDVCPDLPGIRTGDPLTNGCPRRDRDKDGIFDDEDACPDTAGIRTSNPKTNGCPRLDRDKDGVFDDEDACPDTAGIRTSDPKTNGCPLPDRDNDGVPDEVDACPDLPGVATSDPKTTGCPPASETVSVVGDRILFGDIILFDTDSPRVRHAAWPTVKKVAEFMKANGDMQEVAIEGHADKTGEADHNLRLSRERAESVKRLLVFYGVDAARLSTTGYGKARPRTTGYTAEDLHQNRRVEFIIVRSKPAPASPPPP